MKKILLLCDGDNFPAGASRFIRQLRENDSIYVKGLFFKPVDSFESFPVGFIPVSVPVAHALEEEVKLTDKSRIQFREIFDNAGIKYDIYPDVERWDANLFIKESRFADLVVISEELFCNHFLESQPNYFMSEALRLSECPVVMVPENYRSVDRIAIAYDGSKESMHAIKQFVYLFPDFAELPSDIVHMNEESGQDIPDKDLLREYTFAHFEAQYTSKLHFDPKRYFSGWLKDKKNVLLVTGSYSRSALSITFRKSFADKIISERTCPIFISHF